MATFANRKRAGCHQEPSLDHLKRPRMNHGGESRTFTHEDYTIGWICALPIEMAAAEAMLDQTHDTLPNEQHDSNTYTLGNIAAHNIVIACLPKGHYGTNNAATVASNMRRSFPAIDKGLMVGIGGGVPGTVDIRLGDVVVGDQVVQYDFGKAMPNGRFHRTSLPTRPPQTLMTAISKLQALHEKQSSQVPTILSEMCERYPSMNKYAHPGLPDRVFRSTYNHVPSQESCTDCDESELQTRPQRESDHPKVHYGSIASGNQVIKDASTRDRLAKELGVICFEMEAAGLMDNFPCLIIRGICDYADSHKNKQWQEYAAAVAAAYAKELLSVIPLNQSQKAPVQVVSSASEQISLEDLQRRRKSLLKALSFDQMDSRHATIKATHSNTCAWILHHPDYAKWLDPLTFSDHHGFFWISGKPGAGKSTLMKFIYTRACDSWRGTKNSAVISFFFNARGVQLEKSTNGMYRSLLHQIFQKFPDAQEVWDTYDHISKDQNDKITWEPDTLQNLFAGIVGGLGQRILTCFIDALDECDEDEVRAMVENFEELGEQASQAGTKLYVCFSSRHYPHISIRKGIKLTLEDQLGHGEDLKQYVQGKLRAGKSKAADEVAAAVLQKSSGVFMWVVLVVDILNKEFQRGSIFRVKRRLEELPAKLSELFRDIITRDSENLDDLLLCIQWILYARQPLHCEEFYFALVSGLDPAPGNLVEWDRESITPDDMEHFVVSSSKGLAQVARSDWGPTAQFIHESVRDFLIKDNGIRDLWPEHTENFESFSHDTLKQCCYSYFTNIDISRITLPHRPLVESWDQRDLRKKGPQEFPFLLYAIDAILHHADSAASVFPQDDFLKDFKAAFGIWWNLDMHLNPRGGTQDRYAASQAGPLSALAEKNCARLLNTALHGDCRTHFQGESCGYALTVASARGYEASVKVLLATKHIDVNARLEPEGTPLSWAISRGDGSIMKLLLATEGVDVNSKDNSGRTPLHWAVQGGNESIMKLLLVTEKVEVNSKDDFGRTPLYWAAQGRHDSIMKLLLATEGIDVNSKDNSGRTPLLWAVILGRDAIVKILLATGKVDVNSRDMDGRTPMSWAVQFRHGGIPKLLQEAGGTI